MRRLNRPSTGVAAIAALSIVAPPLSAQRPDTEYARRIAEYTSDPRFLPASVAQLPHHPSIPSPLDHFGTIVGAPGIMHRTSELYAYYRLLADATPRVSVENVGTSEEGREILLVVIADERTMGRLDRYRALLARLADPRMLPESELEGVLDEAKPVYYLNGGLHSPEMGSPEVLTELAYRLAASEDPNIQQIRDNVITIINPVSEPDGRDRQVDWYHRHSKHRTDWDDGFPRSSPYWGKYVYHDNNRDGIQITQELTKAVYREYFRWHPTVMLDLHESVPLLYVSTGTGPYNETIDPITIAEWQLLANHDVTSVTAQGLPGVWTWGFYDGWWPGYLLWIANNHNGIGRFYETFGNAGANTFVRDLSESRYAGDSATARRWYRPWPPTRRLRWSARDNVNYMQAGVLASLELAATNGKRLLRNFWRKGVNNIERGRSETPHAFYIPGLDRQRDPKRAAYLVNQLGRHGIEVHRMTAGDSAGSFVVRLDQPYRNFAVNLLTRQNFPEDAPLTPYDDVAWTLGYLYGVDVHPVADVAVFGWALEAVGDTVGVAGSVRGGGPVTLLRYAAQSEVLPALYEIRARSPESSASAAEASFELEGDSFPAGSVILEDVDAGTTDFVARRYGLDLRAARSAPRVAQHELDLPRIAIYHTWVNTQDEGWARFTFEQLGIPYTSIHKDDLRAGDLKARFDVILVPSTGSASLEALIHGRDTRWSPLPYTQTTEFSSHGTPSSTEDMTGGPGFGGLAELQRFVESGGTLITLHRATRLAAETGIARALTTHSAGSLFHPGSVVRAKVRRSNHPILYGYPDTLHVFRGNGPLYRVARRDRDMMVLQYGTEPLPDERADAKPEQMFGIDPSELEPSSPDTSTAAAPPYVLSGMVKNAKEIVGQGAIFDVPVGEGRVIAFTFNPLHRFLNHHEFPMVWNAIMNWNDGRE